jgi:hypothetical protein
MAEIVRLQLLRTAVDGFLKEVAECIIGFDVCCFLTIVGTEVLNFNGIDPLL